MRNYHFVKTSVVDPDPYVFDLLGPDPLVRDTEPYDFLSWKMM
jgi:hypothetical protein